MFEEGIGLKEKYIFFSDSKFGELSAKTVGYIYLLFPNFTPLGKGAFYDIS